MQRKDRATGLAPSHERQSLDTVGGCVTVEQHVMRKLRVH